MSSVLSKTANLPGFAEVNGLPADSRLYAATGSPLLFKRIDREDEVHFDASWLYIPRACETSELGQTEHDIFRITLGNPIDLEDWHAYPLCSGGETIGQIVLPHAVILQLDDQQLVALATALAPGVHSDNSDATTIPIQFVQTLFQRENSAQQFTKRLLSSLAHEWDGSCAAAYFDYQGLLNLLLATGDVSRYYRLTRQLPMEKGLEITGGCAHGEFFFPAELLPDQATFLTTAPDLYFVHQGLQSDESCRYIVIVGPGEVSRRAVKRLRGICSLASSLHESQFHTAGDLLEEYRSLATLQPPTDDLLTVLTRALGKLKRQIRLTRVVVIFFSDGTTDPIQKTLLIPPTGDIRIEDRTNIDLPDAALATVRDGQCIHVPDLTTYTLTDAKARQRYLDNVASEYCLPLETAAGIAGLIAFGSPIAGDYLARTAQTLAHIAGLASVCLAMRANVATVSESVDPTTPKCHDTATRLQTIRRLTESNLHGLSESISVAVGQADLLKDARLIDDPIIEAQRQAAAAETLCTVADQLDLHLNGLRQINLLTVAPSEIIDCERAITELPTVLAGLVQHEKDSKNIDLRITAAAASDLHVRSSDVFDDVVPLLMAVIEQAICSGQITIDATGSEHTVTLTVRFARRMLAGLELPRLLTGLFPQCELLLDDAGNGQMVIGDATLAFQGATEDDVVIAMECIRHAQSPVRPLESVAPSRSGETS